MPLLQVHMAGQDPEDRVQVGTRVASPWPAETVGVTTENLTGPLPLRSAAGQGQGHSLWRGGPHRSSPRVQELRVHPDGL